MKNRVLYLAMTLALPGIASAAPPVGFGADGSADGTWGLVVDGNGDQQVDHVCPTGFTCGTAPIADKNFLQVEMTDDVSGVTYFRTIVATDNGGTEAFNSESFVRSGSANGGISAQQTMSSDQTGVGVLTSSTTLNTQAFNSGENQVVLNQGVWDKNTNPEFHSGFTFTKNAAGDQTTTGLTQEIVVPGANDGFSDSFTYTQVKNPTNGAVTSAQLDIVSGVVLNNGGTLNDQTFRFSNRQGTAVAANGGASMVDDTGATINVSWTAGQEVERVLVGQNVTDAGSFGYERIGNVATATEITSFDLASVGPFSTITADPFGAPADPTAITVPAAP